MARKKALSLIESLAVKADELATNRDNEAQSSKTFAELSAEAAENSKTHAKHLEAVEKAIGILSDAGVEL